MQKFTAADHETKSPDIKAENLAALRALFPELVTEGADGVSVNMDVLKQLVGDQTVTDTDEKYGLNWHGKRRARQLALTPSTGTLRPCPEDSVDWDTTQNLMIEGDNLEVLKLLQKSYAGKVKLIYIDPPYNTGKDFVYPDNFQDNIRNYLELTGQIEGGRKISSNTEASGRFHTDWLNMMYPRLKLARNLLRDDGVLFVSVDERESHNIRHLLDGIFGAENFVNAISVKTKESSGASGGGEDKKLKKNIETLAFYARNLQALVRNDVMRRELLSDLIAEKAASGKTYEYRSVLVSEGLRKLVKTIQDGGGEDILIYRHSEHIVKNIAQLAAEASISTDAAYAQHHAAVFRTTNAQTSIRTRVQDAMQGDDGLLSIEYIPKSGKDKGLVTRKYFSGASKDLVVWLRDTSSVEEGEVVKLEKTGTLWDDLKWTGIAKEGGVEFSNGKKPAAFVQRMLQMCTDSESPVVILDFFAGSGTTAHAVMNQNVVDSGQRRYILVQLPEPLDASDKEQRGAAEFCDEIGRPRTIAELTKERLRRTSKATKEENPLFAGDLGFRVFKLASSNIRAWEPDRDKLAETLEASIEHLKTDRTEQDILFELLLKLGLDLCVPIETKQVEGGAKQAHEIHSIGGGSLLVCLSTAIPQADVEPLALGLVAWHDALKPAGETTVVFRDSAFADDVAKSNLTAILQQHGLETVRSL